MRYFKTPYFFSFGISFVILYLITFYKVLFCPFQFTGVWELQVPLSQLNTGLQQPLQGVTVGSPKCYLEISVMFDTHIFR